MFNYVQVLIVASHSASVYQTQSIKYPLKCPYKPQSNLFNVFSYFFERHTISQSIISLLSKRAPASHVFPESASILAPSALVQTSISCSSGSCNSFRAGHPALNFVSHQIHLSCCQKRILYELQICLCHLLKILLKILVHT